MGGGVYGSYGGFDFAAREARRELLEEAQNWRLVRLARPDLAFRERLSRVLWRFVGLWRLVRPQDRSGAVVTIGGVPDSVYLERALAEGPGTVVEVYLGGGGRVVRKTDLVTGLSTDSFVVGGRIRQ